ncbi:MAG: phosphodiester glycosidase family protein [Victivallales bacterium]|nr:phosphodiester glycosidase family protein [Victivallales bacterium]
MLMKINTWICVLVLFLASCATVKEVPQGNVQEITCPPVPETVQSGAWAGAREIYPGIFHLALERTEPRLMKINLMKINLKDGRYGFTGTPKPELWGQPMPDFPELNVVTKRERTVEFMEKARLPKEQGGRGLNMLVAVNAAPWRPWQMPWNHKYAAYLGLAITDGEVLQADDLKRPSFVVLKNGKVDFRSKEHPIAIEEIAMSAPGFTVVLSEGVVVPSAAKSTSLAPRTGYGLSKERDVFYIVVIDGRQKNYSHGATIGDVAQLLLEHGAYDALNMDGGGSTTLVAWENVDGVGKARMLNHQGGGVQRTVGYNVGIYLK